MFQLQIFDGKEYRTMIEGDYRDMVDAFEGARLCGAPRRLVLKDKAWPARPKYTPPRGRRSSGRTTQDIIGAYMRWAESKELPQVHVYESSGYPATGYKGMWFIQVPVADFLGPAPEGEPDDS